MHFVGTGKSVIHDDESFYSLVINKSGDNPNNLEIGEDLTVSTQYIVFTDGILEMASGSTLNVLNSDLIISEGCGLLCDDSGGTTINLSYGNFEYNDGPNSEFYGFTFGNSVINISGSGDRHMAPPSIAQRMYLNELNVNLSTGECFINANSTEFAGDFNLAGGSFRTVSEAHLILHKDFTTASGTSFTAPLTNFEFWGDDDSHFSQEGSGEIYELDVHKNTARKTIEQIGSPDSNNLERDSSRRIASFIQDTYLTVNSDITITMGILNMNSKGMLVGESLIINPLGTLLMPVLSEVVLSNNGILECNGKIESMGTQYEDNFFYAAEANGTFYFVIKDGGSLGAQGTSFSQLREDGILFEAGSLVDTEIGLQDCTFLYGTSGGSLLTFENDQDVQIDGAYFPNNSWGESYNVTKLNDIGSVTFSESIGSFSGAAYENDPNNRIFWGALEKPQNVTVEIMGNTVVLNWDPVPGAPGEISYKVYSSDDPSQAFGNWDFEEEIAGTTWSETIPGNKKFYCVTVVK